MTGFLLALANPLLSAIQNAIAKVRLQDQEIKDEAVVFARLFYVVPIFAIYLAIEGLPSEIPNEFWFYMSLMVICEIPSQWYFHQALKSEDISTKIMPLAALLAPLLIITSIIFRSATWNIFSVLGVLTFATGFYLTNIYSKESKKFSLLSPLKNIFHDKSSRYMIITVLLWVVTTTLQKTTVGMSSIAFMGLIYLSGASIGVLIVSMFRLPISTRLKPGEVVNIKLIPKLAPIGLIAGLAAICQYGSQLYIESAEVIALKESILVWAILIDIIYFKIKIPKLSWISLPLIVIGTILIRLGNIQNSP